MRHTPLFAALLLLGLSSCVRDTGPQPHYPDYPQQYSFVEEFDNNRNRWSFDDPANYAWGDVSGGTFLMMYDDDLSSAYYIAKDIPGVNYQDDFTLYTRIGSNNNMGVLFGYNESTNSYGYSFMVDYDGYYALYDEGGNGYGPDVVELVSPRTGNYVYNNGDWNDLRLEQRGNRWVGYINDVQVFNIPAQQIKGSSAGFVLMPFTEGEADYLQVDWIR